MIESFLSGINCIIDNKIIKPNVIPPAPVSPYITFVDPIVKQICVENWGSDGEITYEQAAAVTDLNGAFDYWSNNLPTEQITSFNELQYFTGLTILGESPDGNGQFSRAEALTEIKLPNNLTILGNHTFEGCINLTSITIPDSVIQIGDLVFQDSGLTSITIPNSVISIGNYTFSYCSGLTSITIPNSVTSIGDYAFNYCNELTSITIPDSVISIGNWTFSYCSGLTSVTIPNSITSIGDNAFWGCSGLTSITIPNSVTLIGKYAFYKCSGLTSVTIGNSVTSIGEGAFYSYSLIDIEINAEIPPVLVSNLSFTGNVEHIFVPAESVDTYKTAPYWSIYANKISAIISPK